MKGNTNITSVHWIACIMMLTVLGMTGLADGALVTSGLLLHLDASDPLGNGGTTLPADNSLLTTWSNLGSGGSSLDATQTGADSNKPT